MKKVIFKTVAMVCLAASSCLATAGVVFSTGVDNTGTDNVLFDACGAGAVSSGTTVTGCLNTGHTTYIDFTGNESLITNGGQASIVAADGAFTQLLVDMNSPLLGFTKILFNVDITNGNKVDGSIDIVANLFAPGSQGFYSTTMDVGWNGDNKFIIESSGGDVIQSLFFKVSDVSIGSITFVDTKQVRIGVADAPGEECTINCGPQAIPEPGALSMVGLGLLGVAGLSAQRRRVV